MITRGFTIDTWLLVIRLDAYGQGGAYVINFSR